MNQKQEAEKKAAAQFPIRIFSRVMFIRMPDATLQITCEPCHTTLFVGKPENLGLTEREVFNRVVYAHLLACRDSLF